MNDRKREFRVAWDCGGESVHKGQGLRPAVEARISARVAPSTETPSVPDTAQAREGVPQTPNGGATSASPVPFQGEVPVDDLGQGAM